MDIKRLQALLKALEPSSANQIELTDKNTRIFIDRGEVRPVSDERLELAAPPVDLKVAGPIDHAPGMMRPSTQKSAQKNDIASKHIGFFSRFNPKTKKQYFKLRDMVKEGEVVAIVRAMHLDQEVLADKNGKIVEVLVEEGQPVEYGQPLIRLE
jgi:biotin carboxyl carrier protein